MKTYKYLLVDILKFYINTFNSSKNKKEIGITNMYMQKHLKKESRYHNANICLFHLWKVYCLLFL